MSGTFQRDYRDRIIEFVRVPAADLKPSPANWRTHPEAQRGALRAMLDKVGIVDAALARRLPDGTLELVDGHLRAEEIGGLIPTLVLDVDEAEAGQVLATLDPLSAMAGTDGGKLDALLAGFRGGPAVAGLDGLIEELGRKATLAMPEPERHADPDDVPPVEPVIHAQPGDLILLGKHRLLCGDSTNAEDVARLMDGEKACLIWTDPPYGVSYTGKTSDALTIQNDGAKGLPAFLAAVWAAITPVMEPGAPFYIARPAGAPSVTFGVALEGAGWRIHEELQWVKDSMVLGHSDYHLRHETVMYGWCPAGDGGRSGRGAHEGSRWYGDNAQTSVFEIRRPKASPDHPTGKPVELVAAHVANSSPVNGLLVEPFCGSGTTLIAAESLGRRCFAMEIEPRYVDVIVRRWQTYTGKTAEGWRGNGR